MGALVTLDLPEGSPALEMPWIITFGPPGEDEEWEPVVCGPYERPHALALAESVVAAEELMAVVEPVLPHVSADQIRGEIRAARQAAATEGRPDDGVSEADEFDIGLDLAEEAGAGPDRGRPPEPPTVEEVRAGFGRIAARLSAAGS